MSNEHTRDRGNLFEYAQKQKPSQPDFHGDCTIDGTAYEIRGWHREEQLALSLAPPRGDKTTFPPAKPVRGKGSKQPDAGPRMAWSGNIISDETAYTVRAFEKQGKSGLYFTLSFERIEKPAKDESAQWEDAPGDVEG